MGNTASIDQRHVRIWQNLSSIHSDQTRIQMLDTLIAGPEYVTAAKRAGVYADVLAWIAAYRRGESPPWVGNRQAPSGMWEPPRGSISHVPAVPARDPRIPHMNPPRKEVKENTLSVVPQAKKAIDTLHDAYVVLGIDDTKPLTHEILRQAYKRAAARAHPDRGGSSAAFDNVTQAFLYLEEILNKIIPKGADMEVPRTTMVIKAREIPEHVPKVSSYAPPPQMETNPRIPESPPVSLNPKNLDMNLFNKMFEQSRVEDPDQDGYGSWLQSKEEPSKPAVTMGSKFSADTFNRTFMDNAKKPAVSQTYYPDAITHSSGVELGRARPSQYTSGLNAKMGYTDLMYAYGEGSTFSQEVAGISVDTGKTFDQIKRERESAPTALTAEEFAAVQALERQKQLAEEERVRRLKSQDSVVGDVYTQLQRRVQVQR